MECGLFPHVMMYNNGMSIQEVLRKFKDFLEEADVVLVLIIMMTAVCSFALGRYSVTERTSSTSTFNTQPATYTESKKVSETKKGELYSAEESSITNIPTEGAYVASKSGTKYHLPWCAGAKQIKNENKIWFDTKEDAESAGYAPASNCKGI